jgi:diguanylate cyclase (GGDEF)-like protein
MERLERALGASQRSSAHGALMFLDLDQFKQLNDTHGHDMGDLLLQEVANRLLQSVRGVDTVARLGGDEFVVLLQDLSPDQADAHQHAHTVGHNTTPSIGITLLLGERTAPSELLKQADTAMYQAKARGRNTLCFFEQ